MVILISAGCILCLLLVVAVLAFCAPISKTSVKNVATSIVNAATAVTATVLRFPEYLLEQYAKRMATVQPIENDRLLEGRGKNHTLDAIASVATSYNSSVISVLDQIGDIFS